MSDICKCGHTKAFHWNPNECRFALTWHEKFDELGFCNCKGYEPMTPSNCPKCDLCNLPEKHRVHIKDYPTEVESGKFGSIYDHPFRAPKHWDFDKDFAMYGGQE